MAQSLKSGDRQRTKALRFLQSAVKNKEIALRPEPLTDQQVLSVIKKQIRQTQESLEHYQKAEGYKDQIAEEEHNLSVLQSFLPEPLSEGELDNCIEQVIRELKPRSLKDMGAVMTKVMEKAQGGDGKQISEKVRSRLEKLSSS